MRSLLVAFRKASAPLAKWGIVEYVLLAVLWFFMSFPLVLAGWELFSFFSLPLLIVAVTSVEVAIPGKNPSSEITLLDDGMEYQKPEGRRIYIKWAEVKAIEYEWGPWYEDVWGVFPICAWCVLTGDGNWVRIEDKNAISYVLVSALKKHFPGFKGGRQALHELAHQQEFMDGKFHCWPADV